MWKQYGPVEGHAIKPESITCDPEGNAYISDRNTILKINSLTGKVLRILLLEENKNVILFVRCSNTEPNLALQSGDWISTYFVPKY